MFNVVNFVCALQLVRGRRSERLSGGRTSTESAMDGRRIRSPLVAERHILLKADKVFCLTIKFFSF